MSADRDVLENQWQLTCCPHIIAENVIRELKAEHPDVDYFDDTDLVESMQDIYERRRFRS